MRLVELRPAVALCVVLASAVPAAAVVTFNVTEEDVDSVNNPQAVTLADLNGDSVDDAIVVDFEDSVIVFLNDGSGELTEDNFYETGEQPVAVATGQFNADSFVDIVVVNQFVGTVTVFYNNGEGVFDDEDLPDPRTFTVGNGPIGIAVADFNKDGNDDLAVLRNTLIYLLSGNGDGTFSAFNPATIATPNDSFTIAAGNLDTGNTNIDLAVTKRANNQVAIFLGNGDGTFAPNGFALPGPGPAGFVIADPDQDGINDLVVALSEGLTITEMSLLLNDGSGVFAMADLFTGPQEPLAITALDVEPDNKVDLAITSSEGGEIFLLCQPSEICVGSTDEAGIWRMALGGTIRGCADGAQVAIVSGKLDADTKDDFVALKQNDDGDVDTLCIALNQSRPGETPVPTPTTPARATETPTGPTPTPSLTPTPPPTPTPTEIPTIGLGVCNTKNLSGFPDIGSPVALASSDFDEDGFQDVAVADMTGGRVLILLTKFRTVTPTATPTPTTTATTETPIPTPAVCAVLNLEPKADLVVVAPEALAATDLDRDDNADLAVIADGRLHVFYGNGNGTFTRASQTFAAGTDPSSIAVADLNRDFTPDLIVTDNDRDSTNVSIFLGSRNTEQTFTGPCLMPVPGRTNAAVSTDLNNDGRNDFAVTLPQSSDVAVFLQVANAPLACDNMEDSFRGQTTLDLPGEPIGLVAGTFGGGDTIADLVVAMTKPNGGTVQLFEGRIAGAGVTYQRGPETAVPTPLSDGVTTIPSAIETGDIERDGRIDLLITDRANDDLAEFRGQPGGGLGVPLIPESVMGDGPVDLVVVDLDRDNRDDVVVANAADGSLSYMLSAQRAATPTPTHTLIPTITTTPAPPAGSPTSTPSITPTATRSRRPSSTPTPVPTHTQRGEVFLSGNGCSIDERSNDSDALLLVALALGACVMRRRATDRLRG